MQDDLTVPCMPHKSKNPMKSVGLYGTKAKAKTREILVIVH